MPRVLVTEPVHPDALTLLRHAGLDVVEAAHLSPGEVDEALHEADVILVRTRRLEPALMTRPLRLVSKHGTGVDNVPLAAARAGGVWVTNTPGANAVAVAEHTLMLMLALAKGLPAMQAAVRAGAAPDPATRVVDLAGRRLLLVGYGATGRRVAALAAAFGMQVTVHSPRLTGTHTPEGHRIAPDLRAALPEAEVLSLHCPLTPTTRGLIGADDIARLPTGALVINTARGGLIDEAALAAARHLGGVGLDVTEVEPIRPDHPLRGRPNVILTPHSAGVSAGAFRRMGIDAAQNILDVLAGRPDPAKTVVAP
jgi:D-3-phosphoglycerate dehydrogenase